MKLDKRFKSKPAKVKSFNQSLEKKLDSLARTLNESGNASLSAPRAGLNKRIILLKTSDGETVELVNPEILKEKLDKKVNPDYQAVAIKYQDRKGDEQTALLTDAEAVRFYYELEYLDGFKDEECGHEYEIVHGFQDSYEQCSKCKLAKQ